MSMSGRRTIVLSSVALLIGSMALGGRLLYDRLNAPSRGLITVGHVSTSSSGGLDMTPRHVSGRYASFQYPAGLTVRSGGRITAPDLEQFNFMRRDIETWNLAIDIANDPTGLAGNSAWQYRKTKPDQYKLSQQAIRGRIIPVMIDTNMGGFSKVAFLTHGNLLATVSLYGDDPAGTASLAVAFSMVLSSWQWR